MFLHSAHKRSINKTLCDPVCFRAQQVSLPHLSLPERSMDFTETKA